MRQALAGMLWSKQFYFFDVNEWLNERGATPVQCRPACAALRPLASYAQRRHHLYAGQVGVPVVCGMGPRVSHLALTLVDHDFAKQQLDLVLRGHYLHPSGQLPAYEWNFGDVNPPVHAWATIFTYRLEAAQRGSGDIDWLERSFHKLPLNFTWWVNRKDRAVTTCSKAAFSGSTTSASSIGAHRCRPAGISSKPMAPHGWRSSARTCCEIAVELALQTPNYVPMAHKFLQHFLWIASSMIHAGDDVGMWDEEDGFFYDVLRLPDGRASV